MILGPSQGREAPAIANLPKMLDPLWELFQAEVRRATEQLRQEGGSKKTAAFRGERLTST
jgi:hypothetical protein